MSKCYLLFAEGLEECEGLITLDILRRAGLEALPAALACLLFGGVLYLAALQAQGIHLRRLFRLC